jgi:hypothetical protein
MNNDDRSLPGRYFSDRSLPGYLSMAQRHYHAKKQPTAAHARHAIDDDDDVNSDFDDGHDEGLRAGITGAD